jgi:nitrogen regulatory protein PII-like uncharacterized protein
MQSIHTQIPVKDDLKQFATQEDIEVLTKGIVDLKTTLLSMFATKKENVSKLKEEVAEIKRSNEMWMKEKLVIDDAIMNAEAVTDKY